MHQATAAGRGSATELATPAGGCQRITVVIHLGCGHRVVARSANPHVGGARGHARRATEAIEDIDAVWYEPDPASKSGLTSRVVGYSHSRVRILCVIVLPTDEGYQGINAWPANATYRRIYREAQDDD